MTFKTSYSFRQAVGLPKDIVPVVKAAGYSIAPIADISSTFGLFEWKDECAKAEVKPVYGVSLFVSDNIHAKKPKTDLWTFYAIDEIKAINELVRLATSQFRYTPLLTYEQALSARGVVKITGYRTQVEFMRPVDDLFIGIGPGTPLGLLKHFPETEYNYIQFQSNTYPKKEDEFWAETAGGRNFSNQTYPQFIMNDEEWEASIWSLKLKEDQIANAKENWQSVLNRCNAELKKADLLRPPSDKTLREMCEEGAIKLGINLDDPVYRERIETELKVISDKNFDDYFFIVADLMQWAQKNQMVGPGRGSSAGSLVCYLLGITQVDPIPYGLLFFRFLDPGRSDWPDIDGDFSDRDAAIDYLVTKYGIAKVAKLGTTGNWQTQNASNEVSKSLGVNKFEIQAVIDSLPKYAANDARNETALGKAFEVMDNGKKFIEKYPYFKVVTKMTGTPSNAGVHASGVLLLNEEIDNYVGVDMRPGSNGRPTNAAMLNMHQAEQYGMIKLDVLGLKTLTILNSALEIAGLPRDHLTKIRLDDQKVFDVLNSGKFLGIFQFDGDALRRLTRTLHVDTFDDLAILSALSRPGAAVGAESWVNRKKGEEEVVYPHEVLEPYLKETFGTLVFQEQVMRIANEVCGMDWGVVSKLRKAIGKSMGEEGMKPFSEPFIGGLVAKGVDPNVAKRFWGDIIAFGSYSFNKSHTVAYGLVSYWTCYMKAYYPVEFAAATLTLEGDHEKMLELLRELDKEGVKYTPIDPQYSVDRWRVVNGRLIGPLTLIEGIGPKFVQQILSSRARDEELSDRAKKLLTNPKTKIDELFPIKAAIERLDLESLNILTEVKTVEQIIPDGMWQDDVVLIGVVRSCTIKSENEEKRIQDRISRGQTGFINGQDKYVDIRVATDDGEIFCKIGKKEYLELAKEVVGKVEDDKTLICVKGTVTPEIKMLLVKRVKVLGNM